MCQVQRSLTFGVRLPSQDGDRNFLASFRHKIKRDKQDVGHRKVRLVVHENYDDYDALVTDYSKKTMLST